MVMESTFGMMTQNMKESFLEEWGMELGNGLKKMGAFMKVKTYYNLGEFKNDFKDG